MNFRVIVFLLITLILCPRPPVFGSSHKSFKDDEREGNKQSLLTIVPLTPSRTTGRLHVSPKLWGPEKDGLQRYLDKVISSNIDGAKFLPTPKDVIDKLEVGIAVRTGNICGEECEFIFSFDEEGLKFRGCPR